MESSTRSPHGAQWLRTQQGPSPFDPTEPYTGQIPGFGGDWSATAFAAAGIDSADVRNLSLGPPSLQDHLLGAYSSGYWIEPPSFDPVFGVPATEYERAILVAHAAGLDPARLSAESNLPAQLAGLWNASTGSFGDPSSNATAFGILALLQTPVPGWALEPAVSYLRRNQHDDERLDLRHRHPPGRATPGDRGHDRRQLSRPCAKRECRPMTPTSPTGLEFLHGGLEESGAIAAPFGSNVDTNAWAISGLNACGIDPQSPQWTTTAGNDCRSITSSPCRSRPPAPTRAASATRARNSPASTRPRMRCGRSPARSSAPSRRACARSPPSPPAPPFRTPWRSRSGPATCACAR